MTIALVIIGLIVLVVAGIKLSEHLKHPENITEGDAPSSETAPDDPSLGSDRPAGPDAEDPATEVPSRIQAQPPTGPK